MKKFKILKNKKIIITGHTGFKGSWLSLFLKLMGAKVLGISKDIPTTPSHFKVCKGLKKINSKKIDICDLLKIKSVINKYKPDYIFHLAAQPIVKKSITNPSQTWFSNTIGTLNILETLRFYKKKITAVIITSDKVYYNFEKKGAYKENDIIGGKDPYSASKASAEIAIKSYFETYLKEKKNIRIAVARAGNVIGGGDWSEGRLIPDCIKSWSKNKNVRIRNLSSTRPWQHVLEVIYGYTVLAIELSKKKNLNGEAFNFGPNIKNDYKVIDCLKEFKKNWKGIRWKKLKKNKKFKEAGLLKLNSNKAYSKLKWKANLNFSKTIKLTSDWYKSYYLEKKKIITNEQIKYFLKIINR
tara:strand:- start:4557 stop:5621 length:1065 start_codon:yes stop_codon:yes gene_type:complete